jgi:hypothetical protein
LLFQATASGRFAFAGAAWMCLVSLATLARTASLPLFVSTSFAVVWLGRLVGWHGVLTGSDGVVVDGVGVVIASATAAALTVACLAVHRLCMRELPILGPQALPAAVVVVEFAAAHFGWPGAPLLPLSTSQPGDTVFWRFVDVLSPAGISFCVAWTQAVMAGYGEAWISDDPHPQKVRERGQRIVTNLVFWGVLVVGHFGGFFRDASGHDAASAGDRGEFVAAACAAYLVIVVIAAVAVRLRRTA